MSDGKAIDPLTTLIVGSVVQKAVDRFIDRHPEHGQADRFCRPAVHRGTNGQHALGANLSGDVPRSRAGPLGCSVGSARRSRILIPGV